MTKFSPTLEFYVDEVIRDAWIKSGSTKTFTDYYHLNDTNGYREQLDTTVFFKIGEIDYQRKNLLFFFEGEISSESKSIDIHRNSVISFTQKHFE